MKTAQVATDTLDGRELLKVLVAFRKGDASIRMPVDRTGIAGKIADTLNEVLDLHEHVVRELERTSAGVGKLGRFEQRASIGRGAGSWASCIDSVNTLVGDLVRPSKEMARVMAGIAKGDLSQKLSLDVDGVSLQGEFARMVRIVNTTMGQLNLFASEVIRMSREVGTEGKLSEQVRVGGAAGAWKEVSDGVNTMASKLTGQVRSFGAVATAIANGDLSTKITVDAQGEILELKNTINTMVDLLSSFATEVTRVAHEVGTEGKLGGQAKIKSVGGVWRDLAVSVNSMAGNLTGQVRNFGAVATAIANGELSTKITVDAQGELLELKNTINTMVDLLSSFAAEVTRVAHEVGTEGKLGGQARVPGTTGIWKDLTDNVNSMAANLTTQVRGIAGVVTAVANGDLKRKLVLETKGEIAVLAHTINEMIDILAIFADQVTTVAREVGVEGKLGGQARVPGAAGIWKDLTNNLNQLAAILTAQVRAIAEVATAVTKGDLTRSISMDAQGEVAALIDNINEMIRNLRQTTQKNSEQDWLKTNLARFSRTLQGQRDLRAASRLILSELAPLVEAQQGAFYIAQAQGKHVALEMAASYGVKNQRRFPVVFKTGEGLVGQCAFDKRRILITSAPPDYIRISSGLGEGAPLDIVLLPVLFKGEVKAVVELASLARFSELHLSFLDQLVESLGIVLNTIAATMRTEELLKQSQALAEELKEKARLLAEQNQEVEQKNLEVEQAKKELEEKAEQLALTSKYKSEFLANMSHELRTPLNNLLLLSKVLAENPDDNLTPKEVKFAETIYSSGTDLLTLIDDILDLSRIESGRMAVEFEEVRLSDLLDYVVKAFRHVAEEKGLAFAVDVEPNLAPAIRTDAKRLKQILKNLLSNAIKFCEKGMVSLRIAKAADGWSAGCEGLSSAENVVAFSVIDTGPGIPEDKQNVIFEAFRQADGTTSRKYGGTGLGLSISREIAGLLGGELHVQSALGRGSTFTLYLPETVALSASAPVNPESLTPSGAGQTSNGEPAHAISARSSAGPSPIQVGDDQASIQPGDRVLLSILNDAGLAQTVLDLAHAAGFKARIASRGELGLTLAQQLRPVAVTLDTRLPDMAGQSVLYRLKRETHLRHIPVHVISDDADWRHCLLLGAASHSLKPANEEDLGELVHKIQTSLEPRSKNLLLVGCGNGWCERLSQLIGDSRVKTLQCETAGQALERLANAPFDCVALDSKLPDSPAHKLIRDIQTQTERRPQPIIVYDEGRCDEKDLRRGTQDGVVGRVHSMERLLEETTRVLHLAEADLPEPARQILADLRQRDTIPRDAVILIVDDDVRAIFALTTVLERYHIQVLHADSGAAGIQMLGNTPDIDCVLMDVMMPEMDGYETMRAIRQVPRFRDLPIIAVTAKAMKGDREKCMEAGGSDYITKPLDPTELLSLLRVWLPFHAHECIPGHQSLDEVKQMAS